MLALLVFTAATAYAQTGKIAGTITDTSGETLPGVNVLLVGTTQGAVTDADGFYFINNVRPGTYAVQASFVGFVSETIENNRVSNGLTTEVNFQMREEAVGLDEVVVTSERPVVQLDVSANVASLDPAEFEDLPIAGVSEVLDLQAGIEPGLRVRGGGLGEVSFVVDGLNLRTGRSNEPFTNVSYTSLEEVQVQTGGFNAEYGNVRSGIVNVATKEPPRDRYIFDGIFRYAPAQDKALGGRPEDFDSFYIRPALDPAVRDVGPAAGWDIYTQRQYTTLFQGWDAEVARLQGEGFDVTNADMVQYFEYTHRKDNTITDPDYEADFTLGGPLIPGLSNKLGDLRFLASYRGEQTAYIYPQSRRTFDEQTFQAKVTSNIARGMRLTLHGMYATERGVNNNRNNPQVNPWRGTLPRYPWQGTPAGGDIGLSFAQPFEDISRRGVVIFSDGGFTLADVDHTLLGASFTHTLNASTFYEVSIQNLSTKYRSDLPNLRDGSFVDGSGFNPVLWTDNFGTPTPEGAGNVTCFGGNSDLNGDGVVNPYCAGTEPFGFAGTGGNLISGETTGGHWSKTRDTSDVSVFTGRFDLTSQVNRFLQLKTGAELNVSDYQMRFARVNLALVGPEPEQQYAWSRTPIQGAAYVQGKLEFKGMIANLGVRLDYFDANEPWWVFTPYDQALRGRVDELNASLSTEDPKAQAHFSPRLGISFPITQNSKLYFNYGHFRQMLNAAQVFGIQQSKDGGIDVIGNPTHPMPLTVAYELGFDQNLFDQFLLRVSGFYRDIRNQSRRVTFESLGGVVNYQTEQPWNYADVRGAEITLTKNRGNWVRGFINYTFLQTKGGNFGFGNFFENSFQQRQYLLTSTDYRLNSPIAEPFARGNLLFLTPADFGPQVAGGNPLGDLRISLLGEWRSGQQWTWHGGGGTFPELQQNTQWRDFWNFDLRVTKHLNTRFGSAQLFFDVSNVFNFKYIYRTAAFHPDNLDFERYMWSLHLPEDTFDGVNAVDADAAFRDKEGLPYIWVPGSDTPGDFRKEGIDFQPIEAVTSLDSADPNEIAWFWARDTGTYSRWNGSAWEPVPDGELQQVLDDKAYIDMPNLRFNTFLNPRRFTLGIRVSF